MRPDPSVLVLAFYLMGFVDGWSPMDQPGWPAPFDADLAARQALAYQMAEGIARLSAVDWRARGLHDLGRPDGFHERQVDRWTAFLEWGRVGGGVGPPPPTPPDMRARIRRFVKPSD